jgi:hypothetical protein
MTGQGKVFTPTPKGRDKKAERRDCPKAGPIRARIKS